MQAKANAAAANCRLPKGRIVRRSYEGHYLIELPVVRPLRAVSELNYFANHIDVLQLPPPAPPLSPPSRRR